MKKIYLSLLFVFLFFPFAQSQSLVELYPKFLGYGFGESVNDEKILRINGREDHILNYELETFDLYRDSIANPELIRYVKIKLDEDLDLQKAFDDLALFPNLFYLELDGFRFLKNTVVGAIPENLSGIKNVEFMEISYSGVDQEDLNKLAGLPNLRFLAFNSLSPEKTKTLNFGILPNLEGLHFSARQGADLHPSIGRLSGLKSISLSADLYPDFAQQFLKLRDLPQLEDVLLRGYFKFNEEADTVFKEFSNIKRMELRGVKIPDLGSLLTNLSANDSLFHLRIHSAETRKYNGGFEFLDQLEYLELRNLGDSINFIEDIFALQNLRTLHLSETKNLRELGSGIAQLKQLDSLSLAHTNLETLPEDIGGLSNLKYLRLSYNNLESLPASIGEMKNLKILMLGNNRLKSLPTEIGGLNKLEIFDLSTNKLRSLPESIGFLTSLRSLMVSQNLLSQLPEGISELKHLEKLYLEENDLEVLPEDFGQLESLTTLHLSRNFLQELPASVGNLKQLEVLRLENNDLRQLPVTFGGLEKLRALYLNNRENTTISNFNPGSSNFEVDNSRKRRKDNSLELLPANFSRLRELKTIQLSRNPLKEVPLFKMLRNLEAENYTIYLDNCWLNYLPEEGWDSIMAESMDFSNNGITRFPEGIIEAPNLRYLNLNGDPMERWSRNFNNREKLLIAYNEAGFIEADELPKTPAMAKAYLDLTYRQKDAIEKLAFFNRAFAIDSVFTLEKIRIDDFAETLLKAKEYQKSIEFYTRSIQQDTAQNIRILNFLIPQFTNRAKAYLAIGDTLSAIKDLQIVSSKFSAMEWGEAALLAREIGNDSLAAYNFEKGIEDYQRHIAWNSEHNQVDLGEQLSLLELYIVAENFEEANAYLNIIKKQEITNSSYLKLVDYLEVVLEIIRRKKTDEEMALLKKKMYSQSVEGWSFELFRKWLNQTELEPSKVEQLKVLTNLLEWQAS